MRERSRGDLNFLAACIEELLYHPTEDDETREAMANAASFEIATALAIFIKQNTKT